MSRKKAPFSTSHHDPKASQRLKIETMQQVAVARGGQCLSGAYVNVTTPLLWQCANKHQWHASQNRTALGQWCRLCVSDKELETMRQIASKHGGLCLSDGYVNTDSRRIDRLNHRKATLDYPKKYLWDGRHFRSGVIWKTAQVSVLRK